MSELPYQTTFHHNGPCMPQIALKSGLTGDWLTTADVTAIHYTVFRVVETFPKSLSAVTGHENVSVQVDLAVFDTPVERTADDGTTKSVNFEYRLPTSVNPLFPVYGAKYRIHFDIELADGHKTVATLEGKAV